MNEDQYQALLAEAKEQADKTKTASRKAAGETWKLADVLLKFELATNGQQAANGAVTMQRLADDLGVSRTWVSVLRSAARRFPSEMRMATVSVTVHIRAAQVYGGPEEAYAKLRTLGARPTVFDVDPTEKTSRIMKALQDPEMVREVAEQLPDTERRFLAELMAPDPEAETPVGDLIERKAIRMLRRIRTMLRTVPIGEDPSDTIVEELRLIEGIVQEIADRVGVAA